MITTTSIISRIELLTDFESVCEKWRDEKEEKADTRASQTRLD